MFAVVDVETTGLWHQDHGITEISVVHVDGESAREVFHTLLNPGRQIPAGISQLTGIRTSMLEGAPSISEILPALREALEGRVFVGHHVNFDYQFVKAAFNESGMAYSARRLCTLRLSRKVLPSLPSYKLGNICRHLGIVTDSLHRAGTDAMATALLLIRLQQMDGEGHTAMALKQKDHAALLPANLSEGAVKNLPEKPGVYYLKGQDGRVLYVGKAKNLRSRVLSHFTSVGSVWNRQVFQRLVFGVSHTIARSEYQALLLEDAEIKALKPPMNRAQKVQSGRYTVVAYTDRLSRKRLTIVPSRGQSEAIANFSSYHSAREWMQSRLDTWGLAHLKPGLQHTEFQKLIPAEDVQSRFEALIAEARAEADSSYILAEPQMDGVYPFVLVKAGAYMGFGHAVSVDPLNPQTYMSHLRQAPDSSVARNVVHKMESDPEIQKITIQNEV